jgi:hypothetical protein
MNRKYGIILAELRNTANSEVSAKVREILLNSKLE